MQEGAPAHQADVRERHARAHFACGQILTDFCKVCTIKVSHSRGSLQARLLHRVNAAQMVTRHGFFTRKRFSKFPV
jgi:hypothetical protein